MAWKIGRLLKTVALVLCAMMVFECLSAGAVWADTKGAGGEKDKAAAADIQDPELDKSDEQKEKLTSRPDDTEPENKPSGSAGPADEEEDTAKEDSGLALQEDPSDPSDPTEADPLNGWVDTDEGRMYYIDDVAQTGMQTIDGKKYYFNDSGIMQTGLQKISGKTYLFDGSGVMQTGMKKSGGKWYYFNSKGVMQTGWKTIKKKKYYFDPDTGVRQHGKKKISGKVYYFGKGDAMVKGWLTVSGKKYYHNKKTGVRVFGSRKIGKYRYYFKPKSGVMKKGWLKLKGKRYYYNGKGHKLFGAHKIKGKMYYLHPKTGAKISKGSYYLYKPVWNKSSRTKYLVYVNKKSRHVTIYKGSVRNWTVIKRWRCSIGKPGTPTPSGTYHATSKVLHFGESKGYSVWYATGFIGTSYLLHSVVCYRGTKSVSDGRLGKAISHGCIRMGLGNAKWMYNNIPRGTTIYIK